MQGWRGSWAGWHTVCFKLAVTGGEPTHENDVSSYRHQPNQIQEEKQSREGPLTSQHRATLFGGTSAPGADFRGRIEGLRSVRSFRESLVRSVYLVALAAAMVGWIWALLSWVGWAIGV
jgi:hypothetical protein